MSDLMIFMCFILGLAVATIVFLVVTVIDQDKRIKENDSTINWLEHSIDRMTIGMDKLAERLRKLEGANVDESDPLD